jgi:hypothetical protein
MERIPVQSSNVASIGYDLDSSTLEVEFLKGSIYQYFGVPESIYAGLINAPSKGTYLDQFIKKAGYACTRIT